MHIPTDSPLDSLFIETTLLVNPSQPHIQGTYPMSHQHQARNTPGTRPAAPNNHLRHQNNPTGTTVAAPVPSAQAARGAPGTNGHRTPVPSVQLPSTGNGGRTTETRAAQVSTRSSTRTPPKVSAQAFSAVPAPQIVHDVSDATSRIQSGNFTDGYRANPYRFVNFALSYLVDACLVGGRPGLAYWQGSFWKYHYTPLQDAPLAGSWEPIDREELQSSFVSWALRLPFCDLTIDLAFRSNVLACLQDLTRVPLSTVPLWRTAVIESIPMDDRIPGLHNISELPDPDFCISLKGHILDMKARVAGKPESQWLFPRCPEWFDPISIDCTTPTYYDPARDCPQWLDFLHQTLQNQTLIQRLQRFFGYCLLPATDLHRALFLFGVSCSGKSTICSVLEHVLGSDACCSASMASLSNDFGLQPMIGRRLLILPDLSSNAFLDTSTASERIKSLISNDPLHVNRKHLPPLPSHRFNAKVIIVSNDIPSFDNTGNAISRRFLLIPFRRSFIKNPDVFLLDRLLSELPGITRWAIQGAQDLVGMWHHDNPFPETPESASALKMFSITTNPVQAFASECFGPFNPARAVFLSNRELFEMFREWSQASDCYASLRPRAFLARFSRLGIGSPARHPQTRCYGRSGLCLSEKGRNLLRP